MRLVRDLFRGIAAPFRAARLLAGSRELRRLAALPFFVNLILIVVGVPIAIWLGAGWAGDLIGANDLLTGVLRVLTQIVAGIVAAIVSLVVLVALAGAIASPFSSRLSAAVEGRLLAERGERPEGIERTLLQETGESILFAVGRLVIFILLYPPILLTQFIPVVGPFLYPTLSCINAAFVHSLDMSDPAFERNLSGVRAKAAFILARKGLYLGFGSSLVVMMMVPIVNLLVLPMGVVAATIIFIEEVRRTEGRSPTLPRSR